MGKLTHKGWLGVCPVYLGGLESEAPLVEPRHWVLEPLFGISTLLFDLAAAALTMMDPTFVPQWPLHVTGKLATPLDLPEPDHGEEQ